MHEIWLHVWDVSLLWYYLPYFRIIMKILSLRTPTRKENVVLSNSAIMSSSTIKMHHPVNQTNPRLEKVWEQSIWPNYIKHLNDIYTLFKKQMERKPVATNQNDKLCYQLTGNISYQISQMTLWGEERTADIQLLNKHLQYLRWVWRI